MNFSFKNPTMKLKTKIPLYLFLATFYYILSVLFEAYFPALLNYNRPIYK